jgi:hypothetical protein
MVLGTVQLIVPEEVRDTVPIFVKVLKVPNSSDNCAVKILPVLKVPVTP